MTSTYPRSQSTSYTRPRVTFCIGAILFVICAFKTLPAETYTVLYSFQNLTDGGGPWANVILDSAGNLYGTTVGGGAFSRGTVFMLDPANNETTLYSFSAGQDGGLPFSGLVRDAAGNLYGTTNIGGRIGGPCSEGCGTVFMLDSAGIETVLHSFTGGNDGQYPYAGLVADGNGRFYGTTQYGGPELAGAAYGVQSDGKGRVLHTFTDHADGAYCYGGLVRDATGNLYGAASGGGVSVIYGNVFKLSPGGQETVLYNFRGRTDGGSPFGTLTMDTAGDLYGTTYRGGDLTCNAPYGCGVVFEIDTSNHETVLHTFEPADGTAPNAGVILDSAGNLYGTTTGGGNLACSAPYGCGTVYEISPAGTYTVLHSFGGSDGEDPLGSLTEDTAGNLFGTSNSGGLYGNGVVFKITP
jgi:uncharacterized repeat protein (TIGR03803 family)